MDHFLEFLDESGQDMNILAFSLKTPFVTLDHQAVAGW